LIAQVVSINVRKMPSIGTVDERFQSYNIEMVEVIGGRFWKPYATSTSSNSKAQEPAQPEGFTPAGIDPNLYQIRVPINLSNPRLRKLAGALGPAYVRVSGTWANSAYFQDTENPAPTNAPTGFSGVLTRKEWKGVIDFSQEVNAEVVTSVATGPGPRDAQGVWTSHQARHLFDYTKSIGGKIAATEFMNEPTYAAMGGAPKGYDAGSYGRDVAVFRTFLRKSAPNTLFLAQRGVKVIMHNTLASSDYGLLDENTFAPRPNYWAALLWRRLMGATVLDPHASPIPNVYVYAHCLQNHPGGAALLIINADRQQANEITLPFDAERYTLTAKQLQDTTVQLNGKTLQLNSNGDVPQLTGEPTRAGRVGFAPASVTFLAIPNANNSSCR
jgi:hypothetical protein